MILRLADRYGSPICRTGPPPPGYIGGGVQWGLAESTLGLHKRLEIRALNNSANPLDYYLVLKVVIIQGDGERLCGGDPVQPGHRRHHDRQVRGGTRRRKRQDQQVRKNKIIDVFGAFAWVLCRIRTS